MTELVRKNPTAGATAPMAIPQSKPSERAAGSQGAGHMDVSSWRSGGAESLTNYSFSKRTPTGTPPIDSWMKKRTPVQRPLDHSHSHSHSHSHHKKPIEDKQPGVITHFTVPSGLNITEAAVTGPVIRVLSERKADIDRSFWIPAHQPPSKNFDGEYVSATTLNPEELRVTVVVHTGSWASAEQGLEGLKGATFDFQHHSQLLESPKEIRHSTLVLKNLPFQLKHDTMMDVLSRLECRPMYIRYYHDDKGTFKGIAFIKYDTRDQAERGRFQINQLDMHGRKIRVEFKHKQKGEQSTRGVSLEALSVPQPDRSPMVSPSIQPTLSPPPTEVFEEFPCEEEDKALYALVKAYLFTEDREIQVPRNHAGHGSIPKLTKFYHLRYDSQKDYTTIKKSSKTPRFVNVNGETSPAVAPNRTPVMKPLQRSSDIIHHCRGPIETGGPGFSVGRGKPMFPPSPKPSPMMHPTPEE